MLRTLALLLPALIPSWRFFKTVAPSPRIEYRVIGPVGASDWAESHPRPDHVSLARMMARMFWNPDWNEQLFLVTLAERLDAAPTRHSVDEINMRIAARIEARDRSEKLQFRVVFVCRDGDRIVKSVDYESDPVALDGFAA